MTRPLLTLLAVCLLAGCELSVPDFDGDGTPDTSDCLPEDASAYPGAEDWWGDDIDQNCDGEDGIDVDGDGYASGEFGGPDCDDRNASISPDDGDGDGTSACAGDCDDADPNRSPTLPEVCDGADNDCDSVLPEAEQDLDGDGLTGCGGDCGPHDAAVHVGADEACDLVDSDCDGSLVDEDTDTDSDGVPDCVDPDDDDDGALDADDCAPLNAAIHPAAPEACNGIDDDCDGAPDPNEVDGDGDGYPPCAGDCDDSDPTAFLGTPEVCNGLDDDCDGYVPSAELDVDGDGVTGCDGDCNDASDTVFPGADEVCNALDDDCDGAVPADELDADGDGLSPCAGDCDDTEAAIYPRSDLWEAPADGVDSNCDGLDGTSSATAWAWVEGDDPFDNLGAAACLVPDIDLDGVPDLAVGAPFDNTDGPNAGKVFVFSGAGLQPGDNPQGNALVEIVGMESGDEFGWSISAGDINGDGRAELVTGAYLSNTAAQSGGMAYVYDGAALAAGGVLPADAAAWTVGADYWFDYVGWSLDLTGDVDGDGLADLILGAYEANAPGFDSGRTAIFHSSTFPAPGDYLMAQADVLVDGSEPYESSAWWLASGGDVDGDSLDDVLIGARYADNADVDAGRVYLFTGAQVQAPAALTTDQAHATFLGSGFEGHFGWFVQFVGDLDGDGLDEVTAGWPFYSASGPQRGALALWWGSTVAAGGTFDPLAADLFFEGADDYARLGYSSLSAGDVDGDGIDDLLVSEPSMNAYAGSGGRVHLYLGANLASSGVVYAEDADVTFEGDAFGSGLGRYLCRGDDLDGDGRDDLVLGAQWHPGSSTLEGRAYVFLSPL